MKNNLEASLHYSIIMLIEERDEGFLPFLETLREVFGGEARPYEIIVVANGVGGFLRSELDRLPNGDDSLRAYELGRKAPQAVALMAGFEESRGEVILVCGSHQQITRDSLVDLIHALEDGVDMVSSWRGERRDSLFNRYQSRLYNALVRRLARSQLQDLSSAMKVFRREVLEETPLYGNMYRFLPILAVQRGFKVREIRCKHDQWRGRTGFVGFSEYLERVIDLVTLYFITRFAKKPLRFFSLFGTAFFASGLFINVYLSLEKFLGGRLIGDRLAMLLGIFLMVLGVQAASMGLVGEIIAFAHGRQKPQYTIEKVI